MFPLLTSDHPCDEDEPVSRSPNVFDLEKEADADSDADDSSATDVGDSGAPAAPSLSATELDEIARVRGHQVHYLVGQRGTRLLPADPLGPEAIAQLVPDVAERDAYLCGPVAMMRRVEDALARLGGRYVLRLAIGNFRTTEDDVKLAWDVLRREAAAL